MKLKIVAILLFISGLNCSAQISELTQADDLKINHKKKYASNQAFGERYVQMLNEKDTLAILELLASEKLIRKTIRKERLSDEIADNLKKELGRDFDQRVLAENLKLLNKLFQKLDFGKYKFIALKPENKENPNEVKLGKGTLIVSKGNEKFKINVGRMIHTYKGWRVLQVTDYFARIAPLDEVAEEE